MKPEEITEANWAQAMDDSPAEPSTLTSLVREGIDTNTRDALALMRDRAPQSVRVTINGEEVGRG